MPVRLVVLAVAVAAARPALAQDTTAAQPPATDTALAVRPQPTAALTLGDALTQARKSSPAYQQVLNCQHKCWSKGVSRSTGGPLFSP